MSLTEELVKKIRDGDPYYHCPATVLEPSKSDSTTVTWAVSYSYNGGTIVDHKWYAGFKVPPPIIPKGYRLIPMCVGLQLNSHPPTATGRLEKI